MTRTGRGLLVAGVLLYVAAWRIGSPELAVIAVAALAFVALAGLFLLRRPQLRVDRRIDPRRVPVDGLAEGLVTVTNAGRSSTAGLVCQDRVGDQQAEVLVPRLGAGRSVTVPYPLPTHRRAVIDVGPLEIVHADPFGLVERRVAYGRSETLYVHPRVHVVPGPRSGVRVDLDAETSSTMPGDATYHSLRSYVVGDELRRVHWKASAHAGSLMVREQVDPVRPDTTVVLDAREGVLDPDRFELAVEVVASIVVAAIDRGFPVQLTGTGPELRRGRPVGDRATVLDLLAAVGRHPDADLDVVLGEVLRTSAGRALIVVTGAASVQDLARLASAGRRFREVVVVSVAEADQAAPGRVEVVRVSDAREFVEAWRRR